MIIVALLVILFTKKSVVHTVTIPEKSNVFEVLKPKAVVKYDTITIKGEKQIVEVENEVNKELLDKYLTLKDSISKLDFVKDAITERTYKETFKDSTQTIEVESNVIGTLTYQKVKYTIPEQTIKFKAKEPKYSLYMGVNTSINTNTLEMPNYGLGVHLITQKTLYFVNYNSNNTINTGISIKLF